MRADLGEHHVESSDRIRAAEDRHPRHLLLRGGWIFAQCLGLPGAACRRRAALPSIADASANMFKAMHNLRTDRSTTNRLLNSDAPMDADIEKYLRNIRDTEMPAMGNALGLLGGIEFAQQQTLVPEFDRAVQDDDRAAEGILGSDGQAEGAAPARRWPRSTWRRRARCWTTLDKLSGALAAAVNHQDATIDQLLAIKQIAWLLRNTAGEASLIVSNGLGAGKVAPETQARLHEIHRRHRRRMERAGADRVGDAIAAGDLQRDGRDQDRLFRAVLSQPARPAADADRGRREAGNDRQPVDPGHGRASRCRRRRRRSRARRRQGSRRAPVRQPPSARW